MAKPIVDEEAHWRIDEIERKLAAVPSTEGIAGIAGGAVAIMLQQIRQELADLRAEMLAKEASKQALQAEDVALDREVIQSNRDTQAAVRELCTHLCKPTTREITAQLPSGPVRMTVSESRN